jgi:hypothetical protein
MSLIRYYFHDRELHRRPYRPVNGPTGGLFAVEPLGVVWGVSI